MSMLLAALLAAYSFISGGADGLSGGSPTVAPIAAGLSGGSPTAAPDGLSGGSPT